MVTNSAVLAALVLLLVVFWVGFSARQKWTTSALDRRPTLQTEF